MKKLKCSSCKGFLTCQEAKENLPENNNYILGINRGTLLYPHESVVNIVLYNYITINKLTQCPDFIKSVYQRNLALSISLNVLADNDAFLPLNDCDAGHSIEKIQKMLIFASSNVLLNNYCRKNNNHIQNNNKLTNKRKFATLK